MMMDQMGQSPTRGDSKMFLGQRTYTFSGAMMSAERTIRSILEDAQLMAFNQRVQTEIDLFREQLTQEMDLGSDEILEMPFLLEPIQGFAVAYMPGTVNLLHYGTTLLIPKPHGAVLDGGDLFERDLTERLSPLGLTVRFAEDWYLYHINMGEVHCGTNPVRKIPEQARWWEVLP
jgi:protein-arginine deiminase